MVFTAENRILQGLLLGAIGLLVAGCVKHAAPTPPKPAVTVVNLHAGRVSLTTELPGRTSAYRVAEVRPQVNGVVLKRLFKEGDLVAAGQQLYQIDPAPYEATLESARATLAHARAAVAAAKLTAERYTALVEAHAVSRQDFDNAVATLQQDEADVTSGQAAVRAAEINLAYTRVYSPISGRTGRSSVTEGALVTASQATSLVTITQLDPMYVDLTQPTTTLVRVTLRALFPNSQGLLLPGMFVRATIEEGVREAAILAPQQGITHAPDGTATALVVGANDTVEKRSVELDRALGDRWVVTRGLAAGERLIVAGKQKIKPGMQVAVREQVASDDGAIERGPSLAAR